MSLNRLLTLDEDAGASSGTAGDEGLCKQVVRPLRGHADLLLLLILPVGRLIYTLATDVEDYLLNILRAKSDEHTKEEVAVDLLQRLQRPLIGDVLEEPRQLRRFWPKTSNAQLWPQGQA